MRVQHAAQRSAQGAMNYYSGLAAEATIERHYTARGAEVLARRWRGTAGEIDLVMRQDDVITFVEVKKARTFARAAESLHPAQLRRIVQTAEEFLGGQPKGMMTDCAFDVGLVNAQGACEIIENALLN